MARRVHAISTQASHGKIRWRVGLSVDCEEAAGVFRKPLSQRRYTSATRLIHPPPLIQVGPVDTRDPFLPASSFGWRRRSIETRLLVGTRLPETPGMVLLVKKRISTVRNPRATAAQKGN